MSSLTRTKLEWSRFDANPIIHRSPQPLLASEIYSVVSTDACPSRNWICSNSPPAILERLVPGRKASPSVAKVDKSKAAGLRLAVFLDKSRIDHYDFIVTIVFHRLNRDSLTLRDRIAAWTGQSTGLATGFLAALILWLVPATPAAPMSRPNVVIILADDLGYGDISCYGSKRVRTPSIDRLALEGLRFTDAHSTAATCTPSRYALLTGEYAWRKKGTGVLPGNAPLIISLGRPTLASVFQKAGYVTGVVGKWHLGLGKANLDWNGEIKPGPLEIGFDYSFLIPATGDRTPCIYVENHRVVGLDPNDPIQVSYDRPIGNDPTGREHPELLKLHPSQDHDQTIINGISRIGYMSGGKAARWVDEDMADVITHKAVTFINKNKDRPFFLYFPHMTFTCPACPTRAL